jgi:hypothetical protein
MREEPQEPANRITDADQPAPSTPKKQRYELYPRDENWGHEPEFLSLLSEAEGSRPDPAAASPAEKTGITLPKFAMPRAVPYVLGATGLAILVAIIAWDLLKPRPPFDDLGAGISSAAGLRGHLVTRWDGKAEYRLRFEPIRLDQQAGFAAVAGVPPRPLYVRLRLLDASGFALCDKEVLLKFDPRRAALVAAPDPGPAHEKPQIGKASDATMGEDDMARLESQEVERERGKDTFQFETGADGQVAAMNAQGSLPCPSKAYKRFDYWDFSTDFPTLAEQSEVVKRNAEVAARAARPAPHPRPVENYLIAKKSLPSPIEGDAVITAAVPAHGILETSAGMVFRIDGAKPQSNLIGWQIFPATIHFRCEKSAKCVITRSNAPGVLHASLGK